jgi:hypothetical protein
MGCDFQVESGASNQRLVQATRGNGKLWCLITGPIKIKALQSPAGRWFLGVWWLIGNAVTMALVIYLAIGYGVKLRRLTWDQTDGAHLWFTLDNAIKWARTANHDGIVALYPKLVEENGENGINGHFRGGGDMPMDYPPLRLLIMARWQAWTAKHLKPGEREGTWYPRYEFTEPMIHFNTDCELAGAAAMFLLVYYWLRKCKGIGPQPWIRPVRGAWPALFAALLVWFNPASIFNSNGYVQWDVWMLAPFLLAIFFALIDQWILTGICIGVVAMCKGQILLVLPAIVIWQMCSLRPRWGVPIALAAGTVGSLWMAYYQVLPLLWIYGICALTLAPLLFYRLRPWTWQRLLIGAGAVLVFAMALIVSWQSVHIKLPIDDVTVALAVAWLVAMNHTASLIRLGIGLMLAVGCIASPWMVSNDLAFSWMIAVIIALQLLVSLCFNRQWTLRNALLHGFAGLACLELILWPWTQSAAPDYFWVALWVTMAFIAAARLLPRRFAPAWFCAGATAALFACVPLFHTSMDWYTVGIKASTDQHQMLQWCSPTNLGSILEQQYHWQFREQINLADYLPFLNDFLKTHRGFKLTDVFPLSVNDPPTTHPCDLPVRFLMIAGYVVCAAISGIGMAIQYRRRSPSLFFAMVAPWILMFVLLPQMQARYLMWAAVFSAATASFCVEGLLLCIILSLINVMDTSLFMFHMDREHSAFTQKWAPLLEPIFPGLSWGMLMLAGIWLYLAIKPGRRLASKPRNLAAPGPALPIV